MALVSVCILSQNHEPYIGKLLKSLADQTEQDFEVLYLDNCSDDQTYEIALREFDHYQFNVKWKLKNGSRKNIPSNFNALVTRADSEFVLTISADDWLTPDSISEKVDFLSSTKDCVAVSSSVFVFEEAIGITTIMEAKDHKTSYQFENIMLNLASYPAPGVMYRRNILKVVNFYDENIEVEDCDMWLKLSRVGRIGTIDKPLAYYRRHAGNLTNPKSFTRYQWMIENVYKSMKKYKHEQVYNQAIREFFVRVFIYRLDQDSPKSFFQKIQFLKSLLAWRGIGPICIKNYFLWRLKNL